MTDCVDVLALRLFAVVDFRSGQKLRGADAGRRWGYLLVYGTMLQRSHWSPPGLEQQLDSQVGYRRNTERETDCFRAGHALGDSCGRKWAMWMTLLAAVGSEV